MCFVVGSQEFGRCKGGLTPLVVSCGGMLQARRGELPQNPAASLDILSLGNAKTSGILNGLNTNAPSGKCRKRVRTLLSSTGSTTSIRLCCESAFKPSQVGALYSRKHQACGEDAPKQSRGGLGSCKRLLQASKPKPSGPQVSRPAVTPKPRRRLRDIPRFPASIVAKFKTCQGGRT